MVDQISKIYSKWNHRIFANAVNLTRYQKVTLFNLYLILSTILRKHLKTNHLISSSLNICWLYRLICWSLNKCSTHVSYWASSPGGHFNLYRTWHCKGTTCLQYWGTLGTYYCAALSSASEGHLVFTGGELQQEKIWHVLSSPQWDRFGLSSIMKHKTLSVFLVGKTKSRESAEVQRKESTWWKVTIKKKAASFSSLCKSEAREAGINVKFPVCQNCWGSTGEQKSEWAEEGDAGQAAHPAWVAQCPGCERLGRLPPSTPCRSFVTLEQQMAPLTHLPFPTHRQSLMRVIRSWATTQDFLIIITIIHLNNIQGGRELKILGPLSGQALIQRGYCRKKDEGEGRVKHKVEKTFGTLLLQSFQWQCQQYFSPNSQALLAQIYLFTWFMVHAHTNLSMHWHKIFQHSYTFVRLHSISWRKKKELHIFCSDDFTHVIDVKTCWSSLSWQISLKTAFQWQCGLLLCQQEALTCHFCSFSISVLNFL